MQRTRPLNGALTGSGSAQRLRSTPVCGGSCPRPGELLVLAFEPSECEEFFFVVTEAGVLLYPEIVIPPVIGIECELAPVPAYFKQHLRIAHRVAVLLAIVRNGDGRQTVGAADQDVFNVERHPRRVVDVEMEAGLRFSGLHQNERQGVHQATSATASFSWAGTSVRIAARITAEVRWMTSRLSAKSAALPW